jgi:hypothetical protein
MESLCDDVMFFIVSLLSNGDKISFGQSKQCFASYITILDDGYDYFTGGIDKFTNLVELHICDFPPTQNIKHLTNLTYLEIECEDPLVESCNFLTSVDSLINLRHLHIGSSGRNDLILIPIIALTNLTYLCMYDCARYATSLQPLSKLKSLFMRGEEMIYLKELPASITSLDYTYRCNIRGNIPDLKLLTNLVELTICGDLIPSVSVLTNLKLLDLSMIEHKIPSYIDTSFLSFNEILLLEDANDFKLIRTLTNLTNLNFGDRDLKDAGINSINMLPNLIHLNSDNKKIGNLYSRY